MTSALFQFYAEHYARALTADHLLDLVRRELTNRVGNCDVSTAAGGLLGGSDLENAVDIDLEDNLEDGLASLHGRNGSKSEFTQECVVLTVDTLTLVNRELNGLLVVSNGGEGPLLDCRNGLATRNNRGEDVALHSDTKGKRDDVQEEEVRGISRSGLAGKDTSLDGGTVGNGFIWVNAFLELLAVKKLAEELLDAGDTGRATNKDDLVNLVLLNTSVLEDLSNRLKGTSESLGVQIFETGTSNLNVEVLTIEERINLDGSLSAAGQSALGSLASSAQPPESASVAGKILLGLPGKLLLAVLKQVGIEVLTTKVGITSSSFNGEDTALDVEERNIESTTTKIIDENVALLVRLARAKTVGNGGSCRLVDDTEDIQASDGTSIFGSLALIVVEVGGDGDNGLLDLLAELGLSNLLHLLSRMLAFCPEMMVNE